MRHASSPFTDVLTVHAGDAHMAIAPGEVVDLDQAVAPDTTLAQLLGEHAAAFVAVPAKKPARPSADAKSERIVAPADAPAAKE